MTGTGDVSGRWWGGSVDMVALVPGSGRELGAVPLPEFDTSRRPLLDLGGDLSAGDGSADPIALLTSAVEQADRLATVAAAFRDELLAEAYRQGAAEYSARLTHLPPAERREWGARAMLAELACAVRLPEGALSKRLARHTALAAFPRFREANAAGLVSSWHCDVMLDIFGGVDDDAALAAADAALIEKALLVTPSELRVPARRWRARHIPKTEEERRRNLADRRVDVSPADDDLCWLTALLPAAQAMASYHKLSDVAAAVQGADDERTLPQLRADALCDLLLEPPAGGVGEAGGGIVPTVVLTVPALSLLGRSDEPAELDGFGPIDVETARELCALAPSFIRVLTDPETGAVLSVGRERYRPPADLKAALAIRDETCRFPGCRRRAMRCDLDHAVAWEHGGRTEIDNLEHLCRKHHRLKHEVGWDVGHEGGGVVSWTSPSGLRYRTEPARQVGPRRPPARPKVTGPPRPRPELTRTAARPTGARGSGTSQEPRSGYPESPPF